MDRDAMNRESITVRIEIDASDTSEAMMKVARMMHQVRGSNTIYLENHCTWRFESVAPPRLDEFLNWIPMPFTTESIMREIL